MLRFVACDRGRLGGGVGDPKGPGEGESVMRGPGGLQFHFGIALLLLAMIIVISSSHFIFSCDK